MNLSDLHQRLYINLMEANFQDPNIKFRPRYQKSNFEEKLNNDYRFIGNDKYLFVNLANASANDNRSSIIGIVGEINNDDPYLSIEFLDYSPNQYRQLINKLINKLGFQNNKIRHKDYKDHKRKYTIPASGKTFDEQFDSILKMTKTIIYEMQNDKIGCQILYSDADFIRYIQKLKDIMQEVRRLNNSE